MTAAIPTRILERDSPDRLGIAPPASTSGTSWGAIFAGATAAASLSLILLVLGSGLGFSAMSPWVDRGPQASTLGMTAIAWLVFTSIVASGMGGYLAGRLRIKWAGVHTDEVYFRDTAHGFLAWGVATLTVASVLTSAVGSAIGGGLQAGASLAGAAASTAAGGAAAMAPSLAGMGKDMGADSIGYTVDSMFRSNPADQAAPDSNDATAHAEAAKIIGASLQSGQLSADDRNYLAQTIAKRTGLSPAEAGQRVTDLYIRATRAIADAKTQAQQAADTARKNAAYAALWMFVALLAGAFVASLCATMGGRRRDGFA